ncbi:hypothetical protein [Alkaliphilus hydrothermalis]|uniref:Uncharacterized protein n=1 Tax=Alkaliphilus hydrothermalis TaxID=1482730 RepID=A0ABS2NNI2_9FIRM|nr:hypothetical protein [Alkaliphilus hydrothermalis]MBM7614139.1 hypothetical protein [Alkaliphilus hydrothermalis]
MTFYYFNKNVDDKHKHEVHTEDCNFKPDVHNRTLIGLCSDCHGAIDRAKNDHPDKNFDGCFHCCIDCHTG